MLEVWDLETGQFVATFYCESTAQSCAFLDAHRIVAGDEGGRVYFLALEEEATLPPSPPAASPDSASSRRLLRGLARLIKFGQPR
jgi:hypothetical protein